MHNDFNETDLMKEQILYYNILANFIRQNKKFTVDGYCNQWEVINTGTTQVNVNGRPLYPGTPGTINGDSVSYGGNRGEIYIGRIDITFPNGPGECLVTQKIYIPGIQRGQKLI